MQSKCFLSKYRKWLLYIGLFLFFLLWQWNGLIFDLWTGYDMGVQNMELLTAASDSLHYGKDLLATPYPPLSWLYKGVVPTLTRGYTETVLQSLLINFFSAFLRVTVIWIFLKDTKSKSSKTIAIAVSVFVFLYFPVSRETSQIDLCILVASLMICNLQFSLHDSKGGSIDSKFNLIATTAAVSVLLSIPQLVKFSYIAMAAALLVITTVILLIHKRYLETVSLFVVYIVSTCLLWISSGEHVRYLPSYLHAMFQFVSGYSEVMSLPFSAYENASNDFFFAVVVCVVYALLFLYLLIYDRQKAGSWFIIAPFLFLAFKESFVRSDMHTTYFIRAFRYILCYLLYVFSRAPEIKGNRDSLVWEFGKKGCGTMLVLLLVSSLANQNWYPSSTLYSNLSGIYNQGKYEAIISGQKQAAQQTEGYPTLLRDIQPYPESTLGMLSGEQSFFLAYDLMDRFQLNPIVSLWENLNSYTESLSTEHYYSEAAPEILLYRPEPLDGGYFPFRMGTMLQSLMENYRTEYVDENGYLVLSHNEFGKHESYTLSEPLKASVGEPIIIPKADSAFVFMKIDWDLTPLGKLASFVLKPSQTWVTIYTEEGEKNFRFYRTLANNGLYVSSFIDGSRDLAELINGSLSDNTVDSITLHGNSLFYQKDFKVSFYAVPCTTEQIAYQQQSVITSAFSAELPEGEYQYFYAQDGMFSGYQMDTATISSNHTEVVCSIPSQGWNTLRLDFPPFVHEYDILSIDCDGKVCEIDGANDAEVTKIENGWHIKTGNYDPFITFHLVT